MKKAFATFGFDLMDPATGTKLIIPKTFKATFNYKVNVSKSLQTTDLQDLADTVLRTL